MSVDHHTELSPEERAELSRREAEDNGAYVRAVVNALRAGEEPVPLPGKTLIRKANDCAVIVASLGMIAAFAFGASEVGALIGGLAAGFSAGWLFFELPRIEARWRRWLHSRRSGL